MFELKQQPQLRYEGPGELSFWPTGVASALPQADNLNKFHLAPIDLGGISVQGRKMKNIAGLIAVATFTLGASYAVAQQPPAPAAPTQPQSPDMTFFVTGSGMGNGADLGGVEDAGAGAKTWRA